MVARELLAGLEGRGFKARLVSVRWLAGVGERIEGLHRQGQFDQEFYEERLARFELRRPWWLPEAQSIVVAAVPQKQIRLVFHWHGREIAAVVPPTYLHWQATNKRVLDAVAELLSPHGFRAAAAALPVKALVVHSGLGTYGRNNLTYVRDLGSFHRPVAVYTDLPVDAAPWLEARMLDGCEKCVACRRACPTGAIGQDRFLLHAERCLTFHNEKPGNVPFPEWIHPSWHECLVGCMYCQRACPQNRVVLDWMEAGPEFSEEETELLLRGTAAGGMPPDTMAKLHANDLVEYVDVMPRNLGALVASVRRPGSVRPGRGPEKKMAGDEQSNEADRSGGLL